MNAKFVAIVALYAALYAALAVILGPLSYGPVQVRVSNSLLCLVPLLGWAGVLGQGLGVFIANMFSTAGPIDLLNVIPSIAMTALVWIVYKKTNNDYTVIGTALAYAAVLGASVGFMLNYLYGLPLLETIAYIIVGNIVASPIIGWPVFKAIKRTGIAKRLGLT